MNYTRLGTDQKKQIIEQRLTNLEAEHYNQCLTKKELENADRNEAVVRALAGVEITLAGIESAHNRLKAELASLDAPSEVAGQVT